MAAPSVINKSRWMIYGASGYTGKLAARLPRPAGMEPPILAGRTLNNIKPLAEELGFEYRIFSLDKPEAIDNALQDVYAVVVAAGPFVYTSKQFVDSCLRTHTHYLDITGEYEVFEAVMARTQEAAEAGVALLPGVGMDVVPTDCLAAKLKSALPSATHLQMALIPVGGGLSPGTMKTMVIGLGNSTKVRREGAITDSAQPAGTWVPWNHPSLAGTIFAQPLSWGDISTAYFSTGIPNIAMYVKMAEGAPPADGGQAQAPPAAPLAARWGMATIRWLSTWAAGRWVLNKAIERFVKGPDSQVNQNGRVHFSGIAWDERSKQAVECSLTTCEGYQLTALSMLNAAHKLNTTHKAIKGSMTPSMAFGVDYVLDFEHSAWGPLVQKQIDDSFVNDPSRKF
jgi:saccharopine dehydrogenase (NAD+, L-lysine-forming)